MSLGKQPIIGYFYYMGTHQVICRGPVDEIKEIKFADKLAWSGSVTTSQEILINEPELFGGKEREGGVYGNVDILMGDSAQVKNSYLASKLGAVIPAFRGVVSVVFKSFYFAAMSPYFKAPSFLVKRIPSKDWLPLIADIDGSCNPIHALLELLTHLDWGMGYSQSNCNMVSFEDAAQVLYNEGFGLSFSLNSVDDYEKTIEMMMNHINGMFFVDPYTGKFTIKLLRNDYSSDLESLLLLNESNSEVLSFQRPNYSEIINEVTLNYRPLGSSKDENVTVQNIAAIQNQGSVVSQSVNFPAIPNSVLAAKVANRELRQRSTPLAKLKIKVNRDAWNSTIGDVVRLNWNALGIELLVFRILSIDYGNLEDGTISIEAVEDIFGLSVSSYYENQPSGWVDEASDPQPLANYRVVEAPYWDIVQTLGEADTNSLDLDIAFLMAWSSQQTYYATLFELWTPTGTTTNVTPISKRYPLYDVYSQSSLTTTGTTITVTLNPFDFYWVSAGTPIRIINGTTVNTLTVVSMTSSLITVASRTGDAFASGSYLDLGYDSFSNPLQLNDQLTSAATSILSWTEPAGGTVGYIVVDGYYVIEQEIVKVTAFVPTVSITLARAQQGSVAADHPEGSFMRIVSISPVVATEQYEGRSSSPLCTTAIVNSSYGKGAINIIPSNWKGQLESIILGSYANWDDEIVRVDAVSYNLIVLGRGCLDTIPQEHSAGSLIQFTEDYKAFSDYQYLSGEDVDCKLLTRSSTKLLSLDDAPVITTTMIGRKDLPYPPAKFRMNTDKYPEKIIAGLTLSWASRNRLLQTSRTIIDESEASVSPETGTTYNLKIYGETDTLLKDVTQSGLTYNFSDEVAISDLWSVDPTVVEKFNVDAETALSGWVSSSLLEDYHIHGRIFLHDGAQYIGQKQLISDGPGITVGHECLIVSTVPGTWTEITTTGITSEIHGIYFNNGYYIAQTDTNWITSTDLITWTACTTPPPDPTKIVSDGTIFLCAVKDSNYVIKVYTSSTGDVWALAQTITFATSNDYIIANVEAIGYVDSKFYIRSNGSAHGITLLSSPDGTTWTEYFNSGSTVEFGLGSMTYKSGVWLSAMSGLNMLRSTDGTTWSVVTGSTTSLQAYETFSDATYFYTIGRDNGDVYLTRSSTGTTWTDVSVAAEDPGYGGGYSLTVHYASMVSGQLLYSGHLEFVDKRLVNYSTDNGTTWQKSFPNALKITRTTSSPLSGSYSLLTENQSYLLGQVAKEFTDGIDFNTQKVMFEFLLKLTSSETLSFHLLDKQADYNKGYILSFNEGTGEITLQSEQFHISDPLTSTITTIATVSYALSLGVKYRAYLELSHGNNYILELYDATNTLVVTDSDTFTRPFINYSRFDTGIVAIEGECVSDNITVNVEQHLARYNESLRVELDTLRDGLHSMQKINHLVTRDSTVV